MKLGFYLSGNGWKPCNVAGSYFAQGQEYKKAIGRETGEVLILKPWKVRETVW